MKAASTIGAKTVVIGSVHGDGDLELYGRVEGDITVEGNVLIAATAEVKGTVTASAIRVAGAVEGNLHASDTVAIEPDARVRWRPDDTAHLDCRGRHGARHGAHRTERPRRTRREQSSPEHPSQFGLPRVARPVRPGRGAAARARPPRQRCAHLPPSRSTRCP